MDTVELVHYLNWSVFLMQNFGQKYGLAKPLCFYSLKVIFYEWTENDNKQDLIRTRRLA